MADTYLDSRRGRLHQSSRNGEPDYRIIAALAAYLLQRHRKEAKMRLLRTAVASACILGMAGTVAAQAAYGPDWHGDHHHWQARRDWRWHHHVYVAPGPYAYYNPPPVYYAPPPAYYVPPGGVTFGLTIP
jgi:hypothetical protein